MRSEKSTGKSWGAGRQSLERDGTTFAGTILLLCNVTLWKNELRYDSRFPLAFFPCLSSLICLYPLSAPFSSPVRHSFLAGFQFAVKCMLHHVHQMIELIIIQVSTSRK